MAIPTLTVTPGAAARAYGQVAAGDAASPSGADFGSALGHALQGVVASGNDAEAKSMQAISGSGNITDVVAAVSKAELALQTTVAVRDRVVAAYQEIMRMPM